MRRVLPLVMLAACADGAGQQGSADAPGPAPDAARESPDATPPLVDAMPIDAAIDAAPCTPGPQQVLANAGFDAATVVWTQFSGDVQYLPIVTSEEMAQAGVQPVSPSNAVWLGGLYNQTQYLYQQVSIPADATSVSISGYIWVQSNETGAGRDTMTVELDDTADATLEILGIADGISPDADWTPFTLVPTGDYAGQQVRLRLSMHTNGSRNTNFFVDSLSFDLTACP